MNLHVVRTYKIMRKTIICTYALSFFHPLRRLSFFRRVELGFLSAVEDPSSNNDIRSVGVYKSSTLVDLGNNLFT